MAKVMVPLVYDQVLTTTKPTFVSLTRPLRSRVDLRFFNLVPDSRAVLAYFDKPAQCVAGMAFVNDRMKMTE